MAVETHAHALVFDCQEPQHIVTILWACAKLSSSSGRTFPALLDAVERRGAWLVEQGAPQTVADTAWALAKLHYRAPALFAAIENRADWLVAKCSPWSIGNTAWAFATVGHAAPTLLDAIDVCGIWLVMNGRPPDLAQIAYASPMLGHTMPAFFSSPRTPWSFSRRVQ